MKVLLSAFACDPILGSDEEVGWQWVKELSMRNVDITVITRTSQRSAIEKHVAATRQCRNVRFVYVDIDWLHAVLHCVNHRNHIYYFLAVGGVSSGSGAVRRYAIRPGALCNLGEFSAAQYYGIIGCP